MRRHKSRRAKAEAGSVLVLALMVMVLLSLLGVTLLTIAATEHTIAYNAFWSEGALAAADAGVSMAINQLSANTATALQAITVTQIPSAAQGPYSFRSGHKSDAGPQPLQLVGNRTEAGYSLAMGTGYNTSGYTFYIYQINATGTGPRNAQREVEVQAEYGPVAQ